MLLAVGAWLLVTRDDHEATVVKYRQVTAQEDAKHLAEQTWTERRDRACQRGFAVAERELMRAGPGEIAFDLPRSKMVSFEKPRELASLAKRAGTSAASLAPKVTIRLEACHPFGTSPPVPRLGAPLYDELTRTSFRHASDECGPIPYDRTSEFAFYDVQTRSCLALPRASLAIASDRFTLSDREWPLGLYVIRAGRALTVTIMVHGTPAQPSRLILLDRTLAALAPWLDQLDLTALDAMRASQIRRAEQARASST